MEEREIISNKLEDILKNATIHTTDCFHKNITQRKETIRDEEKYLITCKDCGITFKPIQLGHDSLLKTIDAIIFLKSILNTSKVLSNPLENEEINQAIKDIESHLDAISPIYDLLEYRSEERRVGKECRS